MCDARPHAGNASDGAAPARPGPLRAFMRKRLSGRAGRVVLLVLFLCMLNAFDLAFTLLAYRIGHFSELNPLAARLLNHTASLVALKLTAVAAASAIFIIFRRHWLTELACWVFSGLYTVLSFIWMLYYSRPVR